MINKNHKFIKWQISYTMLKFCLKLYYRYEQIIPYKIFKNRNHS